MPFTPYHFGPGGFIGLTLRKWIDIPVFVLASVVVDIEVLIIMLFNLGWPRHRYCHTLLIGAAVGALWGLAAYPLRNLFKKLMQLLRIPYKTSLPKMLISGVLGAWFHVVVDSIYHWDVRMFWPSNAIPLHALLTREQINIICTLFLIAAVIPYAIAVASYIKQNRAKKAVQKAD